MIIAKLNNVKLEIEDLESNVFIENDIYTINLAFVNENKEIEFVPCFNSYSFLKEMIIWLNENNYTALIWLYDKHIKRYEMPFPVNKNLYCAYEGHLKVEPSKIHEYFSGMSDQLKSLDNFLNPAILWMIERNLDYKDSMVFLDTDGKFTFINNFSRYCDKEIYYMEYDTPVKGRNGQKSKEIIGFQPFKIHELLDNGCENYCG